MLTLIGMFLVCVGSQMNFRVGARSVKKGLIITVCKFGVAMGVGWLIGGTLDPGGSVTGGFLGLSMMAVIAAMENGNGGMYAALTGQYGNRSDVGALSIISLNDGPFLTLVALGIFGQSFPLIAFLGVLMPMLVGFVLGQLDPDIRKFLAPGELIIIPFFAFGLGTSMSFFVFLNADVLLGGLLLGVMTVVCTGSIAALGLWLFREKSQIAAVSEASTAGNATQTPVLISSAAVAMVVVAEKRLDQAVEAGVADTGALVAAVESAKNWATYYESIQSTAVAQISISTMTTALLCPLAVILWDRWQRSRGIVGQSDDPAAPPPAE